MSVNEVPKILYRYREMNCYDLNALKENYLYFSLPINFNDPFEFSASETVSIPNPVYSWEDFRVLNDKYFKLNNNQIKRLIMSEKLDEVIANQQEQWQKIIDEAREKYSDSIYCCCFSKTNNHPLMWGHYANGLKGAAIGFDTDVLAETSEYIKTQIIRKVKYSFSNRIPAIDFLSLLKSGPGSEEFSKVSEHNFTTRFCTKSLYWRYEKEYRMLWIDERTDEKWNHRYSYPLEAISEIIFGELMPENERKKIYEVLSGADVKYKEAIRSKSRYEVEIVELT